MRTQICHSFKILHSNCRNQKTALAFYTPYSLEPEFFLGSSENLLRYHNKHSMTELKAILTNTRADNFDNIFSEAFEFVNNSIKNKEVVKIAGPVGLRQICQVYEDSYEKVIDCTKISEFIKPEQEIIISKHFIVSPIFHKNASEISYKITAIDKSSVERGILFYLENANYQKLFDISKIYSKNNRKAPIFVYHSGEHEQLKQKKYLDLVSNKFNKAFHIFDSHIFSMDKTWTKKSHCLTNLYNACCPTLYPEIPENFSAFETLQKEKNKFENIINSKNIKYQFAMINKLINFAEKDPQKSVDNSNELPKAKHYVFSKILTNYITQNPEYKEKYNMCILKPKTKKFSNEPYIIFLGTSALRSTEERNTSSIYINIPGNNQISENKLDLKNSHGILLDCGGGTYGQICDHMTYKGKIEDLLMNLRLIYITHIHSDHTRGLSAILYQTDKIFSERKLDAKEILEKYPLSIICPNSYYRIIKLYIENLGLKFPDRIQLINSKVFNPDKENEYYEFRRIMRPVNLYSKPESKQKIDTMIKNLDPSSHNSIFMNYIKSKLNLNFIHTFDTFHTNNSRGIIIEGKDWRICYTGDTSPCQTLENFGYDLDLLIHECTYLQNVKIKFSDHTSLGELKKITHKLNPWRTCLTHISRYALKDINKIGALQDDYILANDHLQFRLSDLEWMPASNSLCHLARSLN